MLWTYNDQVVIDPPDGSIAFVYRITNTIDGRVYLGKKSLFTSKTKRTVGKRSTKIITESNWREYWGSNKELLEDIEYYGEVNFTKEILHWCRTKGDASYLELKEQILHGVLEHTDRYYNNYIGARIHRNHLSSNKKPHK